MAQANASDTFLQEEDVALTWISEPVDQGFPAVGALPETSMELSIGHLNTDSRLCL